MIWGSPAVAWALLALAAPIVTHLLARRRAKPIPFPTLRFIPRTRLASVERRVVEDALLLALRLGVLAAAIGAVARPFVMTAARERVWNSATIRAEVVSGVPGRGDAGPSFSAIRSSSALIQALTWLERQPPGRRELIVRSMFPLGSIADEDVSRVPAYVGLRFERVGALPPARVFPGAPVLYSSGGGSTFRTEREVRLDGERTSVRDLGETRPAVAPFEIAASESRRVAANDVLRSVIAAGAQVPIGNRSARIDLVDAGPEAGLSVDGIRSAWTANAAALVWREVTARYSSVNGAQFSESGDRLILRLDAAIQDSVLADVIRSVLRAMAADVEHPSEEILPIPDRQLVAWSREAGPAPPPSPDQRPNDGRWLWLLSVALLAAEAWVRSSFRRNTDATAPPLVERTRVA